jgi:hypothetical protein
MAEKRYLGDSVYAELIDGSLVLTTEPVRDSIGREYGGNAIFMDHEVWEQLKLFVCELDNACEGRLLKERNRS